MEKSVIYFQSKEVNSCIEMYITIRLVPFCKKELYKKIKNFRMLQVVTLHFLKVFFSLSLKKLVTKLNSKYLGQGGWFDTKFGIYKFLMSHFLP